MTNFEKIKNMTEEELAKFLCDTTKNCGFCEASDYCYYGHMGFATWLEKEAEGSET